MREGECVRMIFRCGGVREDDFRCGVVCEEAEFWRSGGGGVIRGGESDFVLSCLGGVDWTAAAASVATAGEGEVDGVDMVAVLEWLVGTAALSTNFFSFLAGGTNCSR